MRRYLVLTGAAALAFMAAVISFEVRPQGLRVLLDLLSGWIAVSFCISILGGWWKLSETYRARSTCTGKVWRFRSGMMRFFGSYRRCLNLTANHEGLPGLPCPRPSRRPMRCRSRNLCRLGCGSRFRTLTAFCTWTGGCSVPGARCGSSSSRLSSQAKPTRSICVPLSRPATISSSKINRS